MTVDVVVCEPVRTPIGRFGGVLRDVPAQVLGVAAVRELVRRTGLPEGSVDDVVLGNCNPTGLAPALGRVVALDAGLGVQVPGAQVDRRCGSGLQAVLNAAMQVATGVSDLVVAGGAESMSNAPYINTSLRGRRVPTDVTFHDNLALGRVHAGGVSHPVPGGMIETAENLRAEYGITRQAQDELALESHRRAVAAQRSSVFAEEIVAVTTPRGDEVAIDEHPRPDANLEALAALKPIRSREDPDSTVTAGNASGQNDGAAVCVVTHRERAESLGLRPLVRLVSWAVAGVPPRTMGIGPVPAVRSALDRAGLTLADLDLIELNEAFAAQALACYQALGLGQDDLARVNVHGSGISLGHPVGATGARMLGTISRELVRREGRYGVVTMCIGGGQGLAAVVERVD